MQTLQVLQEKVPMQTLQVLLEEVQDPENLLVNQEGFLTRKTRQSGKSLIDASQEPLQRHSPSLHLEACIPHPLIYHPRRRVETIQRHRPLHSQ